MSCMNFSMSLTNFSSISHNLNYPPIIRWSNFDAPLPPYTYVSHNIDGYTNTPCPSLTCPCANRIARQMTPFQDWREPLPSPSDEHYVKVLIVFTSGCSFWISKTMSPCLLTAAKSCYTRPHELRLASQLCPSSVQCSLHCWTLDEHTILCCSLGTAYCPYIVATQGLRFSCPFMWPHKDSLVMSL